jgi:indole-3-glycerol phosphate synthase/phosphoribosylanthranilate isomerase
MSDILNKIIKHKRLEVDERIKSRSLESIKENIEHSNRSLFSSIYEKSIINNLPAYILECKKASPSKGLINRQFDLEAIVTIYDKYASGISVLTDNYFFQGRFENLTKTKQLTSLPILCKDFFIDSYQVYEARYFGADAILLMLSVLDDQTYQTLSQLASELSLDVLTEVHDENELNRAIKLDAKIIGINNRNLKDLSISLTTTKSLAPQINDHFDSSSNFDSNTKPLIISESGISSHSDINQLSEIVDGFLVGSHLMASDNLEQSCKQLVFGNVKICGLTRREDIQESKRLGATYAGLIFYNQSKRSISLQTALTITNNIDINYVGVFVDEELDSIIDIAKQLKLFAVQLHGQENEHYISLLKQTLPNTQIWKAIPVTHDSTSHSILSKINQCSADKILLDTQIKIFGGSGKTFDWELLKFFDNQLDNNRKLKNDIILAGGLSDTNILDAEKIGCYMLDVNSGIETSVGLKSKSKIKNLFANLAGRKENNEPF